MDEPREVRLEVEGAPTYAVALGDGPPVVLLHGYGVSGSYMLPLARVLAESFTAYVPDLPGQGRSAPRAEAKGMRGLAAALGDWMEAAGLAQPPVIANSMGCQIVTLLAAEQPERVGPMVLIGPTVDPARRRGRHQLFAALRDSAREPWALLVRAARDDAAVGPRALLSTAREVLADRVEDRLPRIPQPTAVVRGGEDPFVGPEWAERAALLLPRGRLFSVAGEPHAVHYTRPDLIAEIVAELLVEEREHEGRDLSGRLEHRNVPARQSNEPGVREHPLPLLRNARGYEAIAFAPQE